MPTVFGSAVKPWTSSGKLPRTLTELVGSTADVPAKAEEISRRPLVTLIGPEASTRRGADPRRSQPQPDSGTRSRTGRRQSTNETAALLRSQTVTDLVVAGDSCLRRLWIRVPKRCGSLDVDEEERHRALDGRVACAESPPYARQRYCRGRRS